MGAGAKKKFKSYGGKLNLTNSPPIPISQGEKYLGTYLTDDLNPTPTIQLRLQQANKAFQQFTSIWKSHSFHVQQKQRFYEALVQPALMYGLQTLTLKKTHIAKIETTQTTFLRRIHNAWSKLTLEPNDSFRERIQVHTADSKLRLQRLKFLHQLFRLTILPTKQ